MKGSEFFGGLSFRDTRKSEFSGDTRGSEFL